MAQWGKTDTLASVPKYEAPTVTFDATATVDITADTITITEHGLATGDRLLYTLSGASEIGGLTDGDTVFAIRVDENTIKLATNESNALAGTNINLTAGADGTEDTLQVMPEVYFIDETEAGVDSNREKGLRTGGWNAYEEYTDQNGQTRRRVEVLVAMGTPQSDAGDAGVTGDTADEDNVVADI